MSAPKPGSLDATTLALLLTPPLLWAGNAVIGRMLVGSVPPLALNLIRWTIALTVLMPFVIARGDRAARRRHDARTMALIGLFGVGLYNSLQYFALQTSTPVSATLIAASGPVITLAFGALFFGAHVRGHQWLGAVVSIAGVLVVLTHGELERVAHLRIVIGDLLMLVATACWSFYTWLLRRRRPTLAPLDFMALQILWGCAWCAPFVALEAASGATWHLSWRVALALLYIGTGPSLVAYACWDRGVARVGATLPMFFVNLTPLFAALLSALVLGEAPHLYHALAFVLIAAGIAISVPRT